MFAAHWARNAIIKNIKAVRSPHRNLLWVRPLDAASLAPLFTLGVARTRPLFRVNSIRRYNLHKPSELRPSGFVCRCLPARDEDPFWEFFLTKLCDLHPFFL